jgi:hypothetical protein
LYFGTLFITSVNVDVGQVEHAFRWLARLFRGYTGYNWTLKDIPTVPTTVEPAACSAAVEWSSFVHW